MDGFEDPIRSGLDWFMGDFTDPSGDEIAFSSVRRIIASSESLLDEGLSILVEHRDLLNDNRPALDQLAEAARKEISYQAEEEVRRWLQACLLEDRQRDVITLDLHGTTYHIRRPGSQEGMCGAKILEGKAWMAPRGYLTSWRLRHLKEKGDRYLLRPAIGWNVSLAICDKCLPFSDKIAGAEEAEAFAVLSKKEKERLEASLEKIVFEKDTLEHIAYEMALNTTFERLAKEGEKVIESWIDIFSLRPILEDTYPDGFISPSVENFRQALKEVPITPFSEERWPNAIIIAERVETADLVGRHLLPSLLKSTWPEAHLILDRRVRKGLANDNQSRLLAGSFDKKRLR